MRTNTKTAIIAFLIFALGVGLGFYFSPKIDKYDTTKLERKKYYDSLKLVKQSDVILDQMVTIEDLKEQNYILQNQEQEFIERWDTVYINQLAEQVKDTAVKKALHDCVTNDRIAQSKISRLERIIIEQDVLIQQLQDHVADQTKQLNTVNLLAIEYRSENEDLLKENNRIRKQRNLAFAGYGVLVFIGVLLM